MKVWDVFRDSVYAGMCIALGGFASVGLAKPFNGIVFSAGLVMIIFLGLQLFTGNILRAKDRGLIKKSSRLKGNIIGVGSNNLFINPPIPFL